MTAARIGFIAVDAVYVCYLITELTRIFAWMQGWPVSPLTRHIIAELRPFFLAMVASRHVLGALVHGPFDLYVLLNTGVGLCFWGLVRLIGNDDHDDRWKHRRSRIAERLGTSLDG